MGIGKILLIGGAVVGVGYLLLKHSQAQAMPGMPGSTAPSGPPSPPAGAASMTVPPGPKNPTGLTLTITQWQTPTGLTALVQNSANPQQDYVVSVGTAAGASITQRGTTQNSGLIAQSFVAGLLA